MINKRRVPPKLCQQCGKMIPNKSYMIHLAEEHNDSEAKAILEELRNL